MEKFAPGQVVRLFHGLDEIMMQNLTAMEEADLARLEARGVVQGIGELGEKKSKEMKKKRKKKRKGKGKEIGGFGHREDAR